MLFTLAGGGWYNETQRLTRAIVKENMNAAYACTQVGSHSIYETVMTEVPGQRFPIHVPGRTAGHPWRILTNLTNFARSFIEAYRLVRRLRPQAVVALGTPAAVPLCVASRLARLPCIYVESVTRVRRLSFTGRIVYHLRLATRVYVQWAQLQRHYPRSRFAGAVV